MDRVKLVYQELLRPSILLLYLGFFVSGGLTVLPGVVLPWIAHSFHLNDSQSGTLLLVLFAGSSLGAVCVRRRFRLTLSVGYLLVPAAGVLLALSPYRLGLLAIGIYGLGLGMSMTSASMLVGRIFPQRRGAALSFLNFCWSLGATLCPLLIARVGNHLSFAALGIIIALITAPFIVVAFLSRFEAPRGVLHKTQSAHTALLLIVLFGLACFLYVGIENIVGGWLTTFALRTVAWSYQRSTLTTAAFWAALLAGRGLAPIVLVYVQELWLLRLSVAGLLAGLVLLVSAQNGLMLVCAACLTGLALASIYPLLLSLFLARAGESKHSGWVFMLAGAGGAVLPWLTGVVSTGDHSLRMGLVVALGAAVLLALLVVQKKITGSGAKVESAL